MINYNTLGIFNVLSFISITLYRIYEFLWIGCIAMLLLLSGVIIYAIIKNRSGDTIKEMFNSSQPRYLFLLFIYVMIVYIS